MTPPSDDKGSALAIPPRNLIGLLAHPMRRRILRAFMAEDPPGRRSPVELAKTWKASTNDVAYHVRVLAQHNALRLVREIAVRGATKHLYVLGPLVKDHEDAVLLLLAAEDAPTSEAALENQNSDGNGGKN